MDTVSGVGDILKGMMRIKRTQSSKSKLYFRHHYLRYFGFKPLTQNGNSFSLEDILLFGFVTFMLRLYVSSVS